MEKERYKVRISDDLCFVGVFDLQENKYVVNESVICLDTAHLLCDLFNKVDKQDARVKELEEENQKANIKNYLTDYYLVEKENKQLKQQLVDKNKEIEKLSLYSEKLYKLEARIGLEERTVGDVVEELDRLRNQLELSQKENQQLKQSQN